VYQSRTTCGVVGLGTEKALQIWTWVLIDGGVIHLIKLCFGFEKFGLDDGQAIESIDSVSAVWLSLSAWVDDLFHTMIVSVEFGPT
jgi:hypothetical protein